MTAVAKDKGINNQLENYQIPLESSLASSKKISIRKSNQTVSPISRKIKVNRKGWTIRAITIIIL